MERARRRRPRAASDHFARRGCEPPQYDVEGKAPSDARLIHSCQRISARLRERRLRRVRTTATLPERQNIRQSGTNRNVQESYPRAARVSEIILCIDRYGWRGGWIRTARRHARGTAEDPGGGDLQEFASRVATGVRERHRPAPIHDSRLRYVGVGCVVPRFPHA
jgi:hypothetical protein